MSLFPASAKGRLLGTPFKEMADFTSSWHNMATNSISNTQAHTQCWKYRGLGPSREDSENSFTCKV